jgi:hypothetical protein
MRYFERETPAAFLVVMLQQCRIPVIKEIAHLIASANRFRDISV